MDAATPRVEEACIPVVQLRRDGDHHFFAVRVDFARQLERELIASAERCERLEAALNQASFCLRELLPNDSDAQMTVRVISQALGGAK